MVIRKKQPLSSLLQHYGFLIRCLLVCFVELFLFLFLLPSLFPPKKIPKYTVQQPLHCNLTIMGHDIAIHDSCTTKQNSTIIQKKWKHQLGNDIYLNINLLYSFTQTLKLCTHLQTGTYQFKSNFMLKYTMCTSSEY